MKRSTEGPHQGDSDVTKSPESLLKRLRSPASPSPTTSSFFDGQPSSRPTASLRSASTANPRSQVQRRLSRPKWLDVDADGGLLKRKTEPATASVTIKGADSIGLARMKRADSDSFASNGESSKGWTKPHMRKAVTLDTISSPRRTPVPSPRRRVSQSPLSPAFDRIAQEESSRHEGEDGRIGEVEIVKSPVLDAAVVDESGTNSSSLLNDP
jgi:hypothetical protein